MKGDDCSGVAMVLEGMDGSNKIFPVAVGLVDMENAENYRWFLQQCRESLDVKEALDSEDFVLFSDRDKGLSIAVSEYARLLHKRCLKHILRNLKSDWR